MSATIVAAVAQTVIDVIDRVKTDDRSLDTDEYAGMIFDAIDNASAANAVWVLVIEHRHGADLTAHRTEEHARQWLCGWVKHWWHEVADKAGDPPATATEAVEVYFEARDDEFYSLTGTPVLA